MRFQENHKIFTLDVLDWRVTCEDPRIVCYYNGANEVKFKPKDINPFLCTHIVYAFVGIQSNLTAIKSFEPDENTAIGKWTNLT
jgi:GH18 family chitinase